MLEDKITKRRAEKVYSIFDRYGFWSIVVGAIVPRRCPSFLFCLLLEPCIIPSGKFLAALALGRAVRYTLLAYAASIYGGQILHWFSRYYRPMLYLVTTLCVVGGLAGLYYWRRFRREHKREKKMRPARKAA